MIETEPAETLLLGAEEESLDRPPSHVNIRIRFNHGTIFSRRALKAGNSDRGGYIAKGELTGRSQGRSATMPTRIILFI